ncbi:MAG: radical SAM protein [bacterium]|nr:radical SAM protein [bacterium]
MEKKGNVIFFLNRRCSVGCASCNAGISASGGKELTPQWLDAFFEKIHDLPFSGYIIWTGGEPFFSFETLEKGISLSSQKKFHSEILTSGIWFKNHPEQLKTLTAAGAFSLRISLDAEHQEQVPMSLVISLLEEALTFSIEVNFTLREIPGREQTVESVMAEIKYRLPQFYSENVSRSRWLHHIPHMPVSPGTNIPSSRAAAASGKQKWKQACKMGFKDIVIGEDGLVYPCCGLFGVAGHERLAVGDPLTQSWEDLEKVQKENSLFRTLKEKGPYGICVQSGLSPETWDWPPYESPCHLCLALFKHAGVAISVIK